MSRNEACSKYPGDFILMKMDSTKLSDDVGTVHYVGGDYDGLFSLAISFNGSDDIIDNMSLWGVKEGLHHRHTPAERFIDWEFYAQKDSEIVTLYNKVWAEDHPLLYNVTIFTNILLH